MIYVVTHKNVDLKLPDNYVLLGVGDNEIVGEHIHDNIYDNISSKNRNYCELTGLYWLWKNDVDSIVGLNHYRRLFTVDDIESVDIISYSEIVDILGKYDIILPPLFNNCDKTVYEHYCDAHKKKDIDMVRDIIKICNPSYISSFDYIMNQNYEYGFNMFISTKELCDEYCNWLFNIFDVLENKIDLSGYDEYQQRVFGFLSERLFTVWIYSKSLNVKELYVRNPFVDDCVTRQKKIVKMNNAFKTKFIM